MDALGFIVSINKIAVVAFVITCGFLGYEVFLIKKEKQKKVKPKIPQFNPNTPLSAHENIALRSADDGNRQSVLPISHKVLVVLLVCMVIVFGFISLVSVFSGGDKNKEESIGQTIIQEVKSDGIKLYDKDWKELTSGQLSQAQRGSTIIVGVETIRSVPIDKARIKINGNVWMPDMETQLFSKERNVYYREYTIASDASKITIEAQLHSPAEGWISE